MKKKKKISNEEKLRRKEQSENARFGYSEKEMIRMIKEEFKNHESRRYC